MNSSLRHKSLVAALAGITLLSAGCRQRQAEDVPPLNKEAPAVASAAAETERNAQPSEAGAKAGQLAADKAAADAKAAEAAGAAAKTEADAKAAAEIVATRKAAEEADARALAEAKAEADALAKANAEAVAREKAAAEAIANGRPAPAAPVVAVAPIPAAPLTPAEKLPETRVVGDLAPGLAKELATSLASFAINDNFGAEHGRLVVQINRTVNRTDFAINRSAVTKSIGGAFADVKNVVTSDSLNSGALVQPRALFLAFEPEAKALHLVPSSNLRNAPDVIVNSVVAKSDSGAAELKLSATDTRTGKVFWTESKPL